MNFGNFKAREHISTSMQFNEVQLRRSVFHIPVRYQSVDYIGQGTFGQVLGAVDAATGDG